MEEEPGVVGASGTLRCQFCDSSTLRQSEGVEVKVTSYVC